MFNLKKQKEEIIGVINEAKAIPLVIIVSVSLVVGFALGASTTAGMYQAVQKTK